MTIRKKVSNLRSHLAKKLNFSVDQIEELKNVCNKALEYPEDFERFYDKHMTSTTKNVSLFDSYDQIYNTVKTFLEEDNKFMSDTQLVLVNEEMSFNVKQKDNKMLTKDKQKADDTVKSKQTKGLQNDNKYTMLRILKEVYHPFQKAVEEEEGSKHYSITLLKKFMSAYTDPEKRTELHNLIHLKKK